MVAASDAGGRSTGGGRTLPSVERVMTDPTLTREQKVARLKEMVRDAQALEVASNEGMTGPASGLNRIRRALRDLGAEA